MSVGSLNISYLFRKTKNETTIKTTNSKISPKIANQIPINDFPLPSLAKRSLLRDFYSNSNPQLINIFTKRELIPRELIDKMKSDAHIERALYPITQLNISKERERKQMLLKIKHYINKLNFPIELYYLSVYIMDSILIRKHNTNNVKLEEIAMIATLLSIKFIQDTENCQTNEEFIDLYEKTNKYTLDELRTYEVIYLQILQYKLNYVLFTDTIKILFQNGAGYINKSEKDTTKVNEDNLIELCCKICEMVVDYGITYLNYNQFYLACAIISFSRSFFHINRFPKQFQNLVNITEREFESEYTFILNVYKINSQEEKLFKIRVTRKGHFNQKSMQNINHILIHQKPKISMIKEINPYSKIPKGNSIKLKKILTPIDPFQDMSGFRTSQYPQNKMSNENLIKAKLTRTKNHNTGKKNQCLSYRQNAKLLSFLKEKINGYSKHKDLSMKNSGIRTNDIINSNRSINYTNNNIQTRNASKDKSVNRTKEIKNYRLIKTFGQSSTVKTITIMSKISIDNIKRSEPLTSRNAKESGMIRQKVKGKENKPLLLHNTFLKKNKIVVDSEKRSSSMKRKEKKCKGKLKQMNTLLKLKTKLV